MLIGSNVQKALPRISSVRFLLTSFYKESVRGSPALLNDS